MAFGLAAGFAFVMAVLPQPPRLEAGDKAQHMLAFLTLAGLGLAAWPRRAIAVSAGLAGFGALIEAVQLVPQLQRSSDLHDWLADMLAVGIVMLGYAMARRYRRG